jgi:predicted nucleic acid-binding protein
VITRTSSGSRMTLIVCDTSAIVAALVGDSRPEMLSLIEDGDLHAPHMLDAEVLSALRGLERGGRISAKRAEEHLDTYLSMSITRYRLDTLAERVWDLRHNFTAYDAAYIALAEALGAPLVTCDQKLVSGRDPGQSASHHAHVMIFGAR